MKKTLLLSLIIITFLSCKNDEEETITNDNFFELYYTDNILPRLQNFNQSLKTQENNIANFQASKNNEDFEKILNQWLICAKAYSKIEVYGFGLIKDKFYNINLYNYPINTSKIENNISEKVIYNTNYFKTKSTVTKGIGAMEYLLFGNQNSTEAKSLLLNDSFRIDYLLGLSKELIRLSQDLINTWENEYKNTFTNLKGSICNKSAKCLTINQIINVLDVAKVTKIGKPAGFENSGNTIPNTLQAFRSKKSLLLIEAMLKEVKHVYFNSNTNYAFKVNSIDTTNKISDKIHEKFNKLEQDISTFNNNLYDGISTNPQNLLSIYNGLKELSILFAVDVTSLLSVTVLPTDNDGD